MTQIDLELPRWDQTQKRDRLVGCSLTGWQDMVNATGMDAKGQERLLKKLKATAKEAVERYAEELQSEMPKLITTVKPEGTLSCLPNVSSGVHFPHAPYYVRRVRISAHDPLCHVCEELGWPVFPEVGQDPETCMTKYVEFPLKAPKGRAKADVTAIEQLEVYKMFMENYVEHNTSITVTVKDDEWDAVEKWVYDHWDICVALSFLSHSDAFYEAMPFEEITKDEYEKRKADMKPFVPSLLQKYEKFDGPEGDVGDDPECASGVCPVR
jgi:ribonucleoside-diphosphate reductase alpha chain/ribonucleoside-triphosphate reductase